MCGVLGIITTAGRFPGISLPQVEQMRDTMADRGPDGAGLWDGGNIVMAHRRLAVLDTTPAGAQPMLSADGRYALVYNGEVYNDLELRRELAHRGITFRGGSDSETVLHALAVWGLDGLRRLRGMYSLGFYDTREQTLLLARDPLGIKPLYYHAGNRDLVFASEIPAILAHPSVTVHPDLVTVSAYLTTIRTVLGDRTLFQGILAVRPGEALTVDARGPDLRMRRIARAGWPEEQLERRAQPQGTVRAAIIDSVRRHLRSDVPLCCLLSGGLDSTIVAALAMGARGSLSTYCAGEMPLCDQVAEQRDATDMGFGRRVGGALGTVHREVPITPTMFTTRWREMVETTGIPLSTPNEVALYEVSRRLRQDGHIVTLSGEGADELFGGYSRPLQLALDYVRDTSYPKAPPAMFQLLSNAWMQPGEKATLLNEGVWRSIENDGHLVEFYSSEFKSVAGEREDDTPLQAHLRFLRRINLAGLLQRLDSATMLASVEGRTPFADVNICMLAESLPMSEKFDVGWQSTDAAGPCSGPPPEATKRVLRRAFATEVPKEVLARSKASFPLPFQEWVAEQAAALQECALAREMFAPAALHAVARNPGRLWRLSWPMINIALWGRRWWG